MLIAAAGLAEAAWAMMMLIMMAAMLAIGVLAVIALAIRSRKMIIATMCVLLLSAIFFQPWNCFQPFDPKYYDDPDVVSAASGFRTLGFLWIATSAFVGVSGLVVWLKSRKRSIPNTQSNG